MCSSAASSAALAACVDADATPAARAEAARTVSRRAIICARVADVHRWNERVTARLPGALNHSYSHTTVVHGSDQGERRNAHLVVDDDGEHVLELHRTRGSVDADENERHNAALYDYLRTGVPPHDLPLKTGMVLILIRNIAPQDGLTNGTKLMLLRIERAKLLVVQAFSPDGTLLPEQHLLPPVVRLLPAQDARACAASPVSGRRRLRVHLHRSQCQTLDFVGLDATVDVFAHGALFVSLSRVRRAAITASSRAATTTSRTPRPTLRSSS